MLDQIKRFYREEDAMGTIEVVIIVAVLLAIALVFRDSIINLFNELIQGLKPDKLETAPDITGPSYTTE